MLTEPGALVQCNPVTISFQVKFDNDFENIDLTSGLKRV